VGKCDCLTACGLKSCRKLMPVGMYASLDGVDLKKPGDRIFFLSKEKPGDRDKEEQSMIGPNATTTTTSTSTDGALHYPAGGKCQLFPFFNFCSF